MTAQHHPSNSHHVLVCYCFYSGCIFFLDWLVFSIALEGCTWILPKRICRASLYYDLRALYFAEGALHITYALLCESSCIAIYRSRPVLHVSSFCWMPHRSTIEHPVHYRVLRACPYSFGAGTPCYVPFLPLRFISSVETLWKCVMDTVGVVRHFLQSITCTLYVLQHLHKLFKFVAHLVPTATHVGNIPAPTRAAALSIVCTFPSVSPTLPEISAP